LYLNIIKYKMETIYKTPSFWGHVLNGVLLLIAILFMYANYSEVRQSSAFQMTILILLFSIAFGLHGLSHLGMESVYEYNPMEKM
jgi:hypothetical protein